MKFRTIRVDEETAQILDQIGKKGETYDQVLKRIIKALKDYEAGAEFVEGFTWGIVKKENL